MRQPATYFNTTGNDTLIGPNVEVKGTLRCEGDITIDGSVEGTISTAGNVFAGINAVIKAPVAADSAVIAGSIEGKIHTASETIIKETGSVVGDITSSSLTILPGGIFTGLSSATAKAM